MEIIRKIFAMPLNRDLCLGDLYTTNEVYHIAKENAFFNYRPHNLLLLSTEHINENDTYLFQIGRNDYEIMVCRDTKEADRCNSYHIIRDNCTKIIAAYPKLDNVPIFSDVFIKEWCKSPVNKVNVKYNLEYTDDFDALTEKHVLEITTNDYGEVFCSIPERGIVITAIQGEVSIEDAAKKYRNDDDFKILDPIRISPSMVLRERKNGFIAGAKSDSAKNYWYRKFMEDAK